MLRFRLFGCRSVILLTGILATASVCCLAAPSLGQSGSPSAADGSSASQRYPAGTKPIPIGEASRAVDEALAKRVSLKFSNTSLDDVVHYLEETCHVPVLLDRQALDAVGTKPDVPVSIDVSDMTLRFALAHMLRPLRLVYIPRGEVLEITIPEVAEEVVATKLFPVGDLVQYETDDGEFSPDFDSLEQLIVSFVQPPSWLFSGPPPISGVYYGKVAALVFTQQPAVLDETTHFLNGLRTVLQKKAEGQATASLVFDLDWPDPAEYESIRRAIAGNISLSCNQTPLAEVIERLRKAAAVNIVLDVLALNDVGISDRTLVSIKVEDTPIASVLTEMLDKIGLTYSIWQQAVVITTPEEKERHTVIGVYMVDDLVGGDDATPWWDSWNNDFLGALITRTVQPGSWDTKKGIGSIAFLDRPDGTLLVVNQIRPVHEEITHLLAQLRGIVAKTKQDEAADVVSLLTRLLVKPRPASATLPVLSQKVTFDFHKASLEDVTRFVETMCKLPCRIGPDVLERSWTVYAKISFRLKDVTLETALTLLLEQVNLTWKVQDGGIRIVMPDPEAQVRLVIYPVADLVSYRDEHDTIWYDFGPLDDVIRSNVDEGNWDQFGPFALESGVFAGAPLLLVWQNDAGHKQIEQLLGVLRNFVARGSSDGRPPLRCRYIHPMMGGGYGQGCF